MGLGEVKTSATKKHNQITQGWYFRLSVVQSPCPWKKDAVITVISQISCILGVNMKKQEPGRKISKAGNRTKLYIGKKVSFSVNTLTRYKDMTERHPAFSEIIDLNTCTQCVKCAVMIPQDV